MMLRYAIAALILGSVAQAQEFTFVAFGDVPYGPPEEVYAPFETLLQAINAREPSLVIHVGDTKSGSTPCSDQILTDQLNYMNTLAAPVLYTPGDNEWTDCYREAAGLFDPLERLDFIREAYFSDPSTTLGQMQLAVESQADKGFPENARVMLNEVMFATAHVVGSNNNFEIRDSAAVDEFFARDVAAVAWLEESFAAAADASALVLAIHANVFEFDWNEFGRGSWLRHSGFLNFGTALRKQAAEFGKPVLLIYGDSHVFRQSRPWPEDVPDLMALEVPGDTQMHAVEVSVDTETSGVFSVAFIRNPALSN